MLQGIRDIVLFVFLVVDFFVDTKMRNNCEAHSSQLYEQYCWRKLNFLCLRRQKFYLHDFSKGFWWNGFCNPPPLELYTPGTGLCLPKWYLPPQKKWVFFGATFFNKFYIILYHFWIENGSEHGNGTCPRQKSASTMDFDSVQKKTDTTHLWSIFYLQNYEWFCQIISPPNDVWPAIIIPEGLFGEVILFHFLRHIFRCASSLLATFQIAPAKIII